MKRQLSRFTFFLIICLTSSTLNLAIASPPLVSIPFDINNIPEPVPPPREVQVFFQLDPYYQQWINVRGFPVLASTEVNPYTVKEAAWTIGQMVGHRPDILEAMAQITARFSIVPHNKHLPDIPEYDFGRLDFFWEMRARGVGGLTTTSPEENIICGDSNYCYAELVHEFAHQLHHWGLNRIDSTFDNRLETMYNAALKEGLYQNRYAGSNRHEYWAEGVGSWFNGPHPNNVAHTRLALKKYDPRLAKLLTEVFGDRSWRYTPPATRTHLPHLQRFNPQEAPIYQRPPELLELEKQLRDPNSNGGGKWVNLKLYDPSGLSHLRKLTTGGNRTDFLFGNLAGTDLALYSFNADGKKVLYQYITTTDFWHVITEVGAIWLIQDHTGKDLAVFRAEEEVGRVLITPTTVFITPIITPGLSKVSGGNQISVPGAVLANPFVIEVRADNLSVLEGILVTFTVTAGDGTLSVTHTTTDQNGRAESTLTLGPNLGTNAVSVSAAGIEHPVTFNAMAEAGVHIPNTNLRTAIETYFGKAEGDLITPSEMATLPRLEAQNANISDLTGLEHATNLTHLYLPENSISDISPLAGLTNLTYLSLADNSLTDISSVAGLTNLTELHLGGNSLTDISSVAGLTNLTGLHLPGNPIADTTAVDSLTQLTWLYLGGTNITDVSPVSGLINLRTLRLEHNSISDISPLVANPGLGSGDEVHLSGTRLNYASIYTHIPALQAREVGVFFDSRTPQRIRIVSGDDQQGLPGAALEKPLVVEVQDENRVAFEGVPVAFAVTSGGGTLGAGSVTTDANGRAESILMLGPHPGTNTVEVAVAEIREKQTFNAEGIGMPKSLEIVSGDSQQGQPGTALEKAFVVEVKDQTNKPVADVEVTFSVTSGGGTLSARSVTTAADGRAQSTLTLGPNPGTNTVTVSVSRIQEEKTFSAEGVRIPKTLEIISGIDQQGLPGVALHSPFLVEVQDKSGGPLPRVQVMFTVTSGGGTLNATSATTNNNGRAWVILTLGPNPGVNTVTVSVTGIAETLTFTAEGIRIPLAFWIISGFDQKGVTGEALAYPFVVDVRDHSGEPFLDAQVTFTVTSGGGTLSVTSVTTDANGRAESTLTLGPNPGTNTVTVSVAGIQKKQLVSTIAELPPIPEDVNRDDVVNIFDLVSVASALGDEGADLAVDVNGDGVINVLDLVLVAGALGNTAAAPSAWYRDLEIAPTRAEVGGWLTQAQTLDLTDARTQMGVLALEQLAAALTPEKTALLPNYPNPFNPETWIPYQLSRDAEVALTIYDASGLMVRRLELRHQLVGYYSDRGKAVHWDGRNNLGESVASGVYFYHLTAGDFSATRKMLIMK